MSRKKRIRRYITDQILYVLMNQDRVKLQSIKSQMILGKYRVKRKLGKGSFASVVLVEDADGSQWALKIISKKELAYNQLLQQYIEGEKECLMNLKSQYVMRLYGTEEDQQNIYFVCEYCDGGDLINSQAKQPKKVFELGKATKILTEIIFGLEFVHKAGYVHRDIKPQNILLKSNVEGQYMQYYKLTDFGCAKKIEDIGGTVLGTKNYMSPEIYVEEEQYGNEVDMWAFGVLFYFMLNLQFPFKINPHCKDMDQNRKDLIEQAKAFKYSEAVKKSKKKIIENCTSEMDDLFARIFNTNPAERIDFSEIKQHPIFKHHFPTFSSSSKIVKKTNKTMIGPNQFDSFILTKNSEIQKKQSEKSPKREEEDMKIQHTSINQWPILGKYRVKRKLGKGSLVFSSQQIFSQQYNYLDCQFKKIQFLATCKNQFFLIFYLFSFPEIFMIKYCLWKYYIILLRQFINNSSPTILSKKIALKWEQYYKTDMLMKQLRTHRQQLSKAELKMTRIFRLCRSKLSSITRINPYFEKIFENNITDENFSTYFLYAYRVSTGLAYCKFKEVFNNGNKFVYLITLTVLCYGFDRIMKADEKQLEAIFSIYLRESSEKKKYLDFEDIHNWLQHQDKQNLKIIIKNMFR